MSQMPNVLSVSDFKKLNLKIANSPNKNLKQNTKVVKKVSGIQIKSTPNKMELLFQEKLEQHPLVQKVMFEAITFNLAPKTTYTPDLIVWDTANNIHVIEVKGKLRDDASVKFKMACKLFPLFNFCMATYTKSKGIKIRMYSHTIPKFLKDINPS